MILQTLLLLMHLLLPISAYNVHTGFNYGAFWGTTEKPKRQLEYEAAFKAAYSLNTSVAFDSARLFTCRQPGTTDTWIEAFDAAINTHTYLLLGFYLSEVKASARKSGQTYETNAQMLGYELSALDKALSKYGSKLGGLIIGLSVGNEDMEQWYAGSDTGVTEKVITANIDSVRTVINGGSYNGRSYPNIMKYMTKTPVGHTDTVPHAVKVKKVDFVGMNAYPYWSADPPNVMKQSYFGSVNATKIAMPGKDVWLTEVGWPFKDTSSPMASQGTANKENLQKYWNDIGCNIFGKYTAFWFELTQDTLADQPDWAIMDELSDAGMRIDVSCGIGRKTWAQRRDVPDPSALPSTSLTLPSTSETTKLVPSASDIPAASQKIYTGFSYGAFWSESEPKQYKDFLRQFMLARNLPNVPVPFTSARLYQAAQWGSPTEPSEAFQAAIETNTTLLIGLWLPIDKELIALDKAFEKYGQKLVDLVIGIAVGNEDIYRGSADCAQKEGKPCPMAATENEVMANITQVKDWVRQKPWYKLFKTPPPIGHADTARNAALKNSDFLGANIFPFWHPDPIDKAWESFEFSLQDIKERAGNAPVWITETGWPSAGNDTTASLENMQKYWSTVGCSLIGKYTTFWFQLEKDTHDPGNLDWGIIDLASQKPKFQNLTCLGQPGPPAVPSLNSSTTIALLPSSSSNLTVSGGYTSTETTDIPVSETSPVNLTGGMSTVHTIITSTITLYTVVESESPSNQDDVVTVTSFLTVGPEVSLTLTLPIPSSPTVTSDINTSIPVISLTDPSGCITISTDANGQQITISNPLVDGKCAISTYVPPSNTTASVSSQITSVSDVHPSGCVVVEQNPDGKLVTLTTNFSGMCPSPTVTQPTSDSNVTQGISITSTPTVFVTVPTGCITVAKDANDQYVSVASNPPVDGKCLTPTYVAPSSSEYSSKHEITIIVSPSPVTAADATSSSSSSL